MTTQDPREFALDQVDAKRRGFLGKLLATGAAAAALPTLSTVALGAEPQERDGEGKGKGKGKGERGKGERRDPAMLAERLIAAHDKDGDGALNKDELTAALTQMLGRRGGGERDGKGKGKGKGDGGNR